MCIQEEALCIICKKLGVADLLKITSFRQFQIAHTKAQTPIRILAFVVLSTPCNQLPNILVTLVGGLMLNVKWRTLQTRRAIEHEINK